MASSPTSRALVGLFVTGMLLTGCANTLLLKYQDQACEAQARPGFAAGCNSFPIIQSFAMFSGESLCFVVVGLSAMYSLFFRGRSASHHHPTGAAGYTPLFADDTHRQSQTSDRADDADLDTSIATNALHKDSNNPPLVGRKTLYLALPAICDIIGTTIMSIGLLFVPASIFQMCRGALVLFVGLFSVIFLRRQLARFQWFALFQVTAGVFLVGLSTVIGARPSTPHEPTSAESTNFARTLAGVLMIVGAQIFTASQFVLEEFILGKYSIEPIKVAGYEGIYGLFIVTTGMFIAHITYGSTPKGADTTWDVQSGLNAIGHDPKLVLAFMIFAVSIAAFNFFGLSVTRTVSATSRSTIDTCRTLFIWAVSLALGWETFKVLQLIGFVLLVHATLVFNGVVRPLVFADRRGDHMSRQSAVDPTRPNTLE
ncbi:hypothetical protein PYCC9005_002292 [Savitreella phatthalungensis]